MIIKEARIQNFRSIFDETLACENLTAIVGANGTGKSSFLRALDLFYAATPHVELDDFYNRDASKPIVIAVSFVQLNDDAKIQFESYLQGDALTVERMIHLTNGKTVARFYGSRMSNPAFAQVRTEDKAAAKRTAYESLRSTSDYADMPKWKSVAETEKTLRDWEEQNPEKCTHQRDDGQFFGFSEVAQGYLGRFTRFLFVPAVREASSDAEEGRGSVLTDLMDLVIRSALASNTDLIALQQEMQEKYDQILDPSKLPEINVLASRLTETLTSYVPDAKVNLSWKKVELEIPAPRADVKLTEDEYETTVERTGHGLQRAFVITMLQHLAMAKAQPEAPRESAVESAKPTSSNLPNLVLAIEEPELYQHPNRQRHFARILSALASGITPGVANATQIIYATHSPLFVGIDRIHQVRLLRKARIAAGAPKVARVIRTDLNSVAETIWQADGANGEKFTGEGLLPRLQTIMTPWMSEGFFAELVVLVEGEDDRVALLGTALAMNHDFESLGISVIPCMGKSNLDRPLVIFGQLGIKTYVVWDNDNGEKEPNIGDNHRLLRILGEPVADWPSGIYSRYAALEPNLERAIETELEKEYFDLTLAGCQKRFGIPKRKHAIKNPVVISELLKKARADGKCCATLESIVLQILELHKQ